jgi:DNA primase
MGQRCQAACLSLLLVPLLTLGCAGGAPSRGEPAQPAAPSAAAVPTMAAARTTSPVLTGTQDPTQAWTSALATLDSQLTSEPCSPDKVIAYSNAVLPLADEHMADAAVARRLADLDDQALVDDMYDRAVHRRDRLASIVAPYCASTAHLKFNSAFRLLVDVWDHIAEREFDLAQRKLESSFDELAKGARLLTELQSRIPTTP